jgi:KipI family sensor histidine kinase inhibitor
MTQDFPQFRPQGDQGLMVYLGQGIDPALNARVRHLAQALSADPPAGVGEVLAAYCSLLVRLDPLAIEHGQVEAWVRRMLAALPPVRETQGRVVEVPVVYGGEHGPDLEEVANRAGLEPAEVIRRHAGRDYLCYLVGFTPGFPFLGGLDPRLATPRLDSPRPDLPPGAVGIGADQTGLYPLGGPGGWRILGRTPQLIYDPRREPPFLIAAGDHVRFTPVPVQDFPAPPPAQQLWQDQGQPVFQVLSPGGLTTVQDQGRGGWLERGVPVSGALDQYALLAANALVDNPPEAAALELTLMGPKLRVLSPTLAAVCGADLGLQLDGRPAPAWTPLALNPGQVLSLPAPRDGARAMLAVAGGLAAQPLLGSRSTYALGRLGAPLRTGDIIKALPSALPSPGPALPPELRPRLGRVITLRVLAGPNQDYFTPQGRETFYASEYRLSSRADRRGARLEGPAVELDPARPSSIVSEPNLPGIVQVPPDGQPMVLLNEQTVGGYAKIATIISPDLDLLARALPGDAVRFAKVDMKEALDVARQRAKQLDQMRQALRPV